MTNTPSKAEIEALVKRHGATSYRNRAASPTPPAEQAAPKAATEEQALYTVDEVFDAIFETTKHLDIDPPLGLY